MEATEAETPDDLLSLTLDVEEAISAQNAMPTETNNSVSNVVNISNTTTDQIANFKLEVPGFDWEAMLNASKPQINLSNCQVTMNFGK